MLTPEMVAQIRMLVVIQSGSDWRDLLHIIDAYEAQRPRPASEVPKSRETVLIYYGYGGNPLCSTGYYVHGAEMPWRTDRSGRFPSEAVHYWLPLPEVPE